MLPAEEPVVAEAVLLIGTRKGLFVARSQDNRKTWSVSPPQFPDIAVYAVGIDSRSDPVRMFASITSQQWGPSLAHSDDLGVSWTEPARSPVLFPEFTGASLERIWQVQPGCWAEPGVIYVGTEPSALFRSADGGTSFDLVRSLWDHPHRPKWEPGNGGQAIHTILPHPAEPERVLVAMSAGGVYRTEDGGETWDAANQGIRADFLPNEYPEFGQCVHKVAADPADPDRLYLQNHGGVYRSDDWGQQWRSIADGLPSDFGFPVITHPSRTETLYVFPLGDGTPEAARMPAEGRCQVYRSADGGASWQPLSAGLPERGFWVSVLRDALCTDGGDPAGIYLGTRDGQAYASADEGETWGLVAQHLPDVLSVRACALS